MSDEKLDAGPGPDAYQAQHMARGALYHDKIRAPLPYHLMFLLPLSVVVGTAILGRVPLVLPVFYGLMLFLLWAIFAALRVSVTRDEVFVQYGLFGPKIALRDITSCEAVDYAWTKYGGWGIRRGRDGSVAYNMIGDGGRAVRIVHRKGAKTQTVLLASRDPERLAAAIQQARAEAGAGTEPKAAEGTAETQKAAEGLRGEAPVADEAARAAEAATRVEAAAEVEAAVEGEAAAAEAAAVEGEAGEARRQG